ncbi:hypothetical protein [Snodgrassella gandavensis]|uniref:hypothetical protein n=1 Tax=Snodgrassella gandavensis TaxID=2946698 RepID=UPI001EF5DF60|nr:hypothetical protein [Snodgrassella gandavensis]
MITSKIQQAEYTCLHVIHPPVRSIHFLKQIPQTAQTTIAHAAIQADTDLPKSQLELERRQPVCIM